ncbi:peptidase M4 family protein [Methylobacterium sp. WL69]|uniref:M4 family metallopeptidase n=1 Tax=Methylobacterium sp. WL69 TaxID=2603893 RepID=UPI0011C77772|nr:M4 family metallopeptidase [Methylobacterium sp. WL69]TXM74202.1 peptidase M4 family protein [Methylobacterium sp. WL69]
MSGVSLRTSGFVSPGQLKRLSRSQDERLRDIAFETVQSCAVEAHRRETEANHIAGAGPNRRPGKARCVYDMEGGTRGLPGRLARDERGNVGTDEIVERTFANMGLAYDFLSSTFGPQAVTGWASPMVCSVHYGNAVANAFWTGRQAVFGDGDGHYFLPFSRALDVVTHELCHGVVRFSSNLEYAGEPGALNESFCDVMGALARQWHLGHAADAADWLLGGDIVGPGLAVAALRSFRETPVYQGHPALGDDDQPKHMNDFVTTVDDHGGVHENVGIPNRAFHEAAMAIGGRAWESAGRVWYEAFTGLPSRSNFAAAAAATVATASRLFSGSSREADAFRHAWNEVGIDPGGT